MSAALLEPPAPPAPISSDTPTDAQWDIKSEPLESPPPGDPTTLPPGLLHWRFSVEQYHRMLDAGILTDGDRVELLDGWLIAKDVKKRPHVLSNALVQAALAKIVPTGWYVSAQDPITTDRSEPEPDVAVVRGSLRDYPDTHPTPEDTALVVEIADSSLHKDRRLKKHLYARASVPVYWVVNLPKRRLEVYTEPTGSSVEKPDYRRRQYFESDAAVPFVLDGQEITRLSVVDLLP